jgi:hypothetical protein
MQTPRAQYLSALKFHLGNLIHGYGVSEYDGHIPLSVIRLYYRIAKDRAAARYPSGASN